MSPIATPCSAAHWALTAICPAVGGAPSTRTVDHATSPYIATRCSPYLLVSEASTGITCAVATTSCPSAFAASTWGGMSVNIGGVAERHEGGRVPVGAPKRSHRRRGVRDGDGQERAVRRQCNGDRDQHRGGQRVPALRAQLLANESPDHAVASMRDAVMGCGVNVADSAAPKIAPIAAIAYADSAQAPRCSATPSRLWRRGRPRCSRGSMPRHRAQPQVQAKCPTPG